MSHWVEQRIRVTARRTLVAWSLVLGAVGLAYFGNAAYFADFVSGAVEADGTELGAIGSLDGAPHRWVRVAGAEAIDTGIQQIEVEKRGGVETSRKVVGSWYALEVGDRYLFVKGTPAMPTRVEGGLEPIPASFNREFFSTQEMRASRSRFYPFYLDTRPFRTPGYLALAATGVLLAVFGVYGLRALRRMRDPGSHPAAQRMASWGDPVSIQMNVEREQASPRYKTGGWRVTDNYLVQSRFFRFDLLRFEDLLWAYEKVTRHSVNFIPTGKTYAAVFVCAGASAEVSGKQKTVEALLELAAQRVPWAVFGYSQELDELARKNPAALIQAVDERRRAR